MPIYEYRCTKCEAVFEKIQPMDSEAPACETCGSATRKLISAPAIQFKGSGWYVSDYARKSAKSSSSDSAPACGSKDGGCGKAACSTEAAS